MNFKGQGWESSFRFQSDNELSTLYPLHDKHHLLSQYHLGNLLTSFHLHVCSCGNQSQASTAARAWLLNSSQTLSVPSALKHVSCAFDFYCYYFPVLFGKMIQFQSLLEMMVFSDSCCGYIHSHELTSPTPVS